MSEPPTLYHYTCQHGRDRIGLSGILYPGADLRPRQRIPFPATLLWLTDMARPNRDALGLTSRLLQCDRTRYRYRIEDPTGAVPWLDVRRGYPPRLVEALETTPDARLRHWWVSLDPLPATYDPIVEAEP